MCVCSCPCVCVERVFSLLVLRTVTPYFPRTTFPSRVHGIPTVPLPPMVLADKSHPVAVKQNAISIGKARAKTYRHTTTATCLVRKSLFKNRAKYFFWKKIKIHRSGRTDFRGGASAGGAISMGNLGQGRIYRGGDVAITPLDFLKNRQKNPDDFFFFAYSIF